MIYKIAATLLPVVFAWGALGWYAWRLETRRNNRVQAATDIRRGRKLSETPHMVHAINWRPEP
jgi:hypothetical protein